MDSSQRVTPDYRWMVEHRAGIERACARSRPRSPGVASLVLPVVAVLLLTWAVVDQRGGAARGLAIPLAALVAGGTGAAIVVGRRQAAAAGSASLSLGVLMQANYTLFMPGTNAAWAVVMTTDDQRLLDDPDLLEQVAGWLHRFRGSTEPVGVWLDNQNVLDKSGRIRGGIAVPPSECGNNCTWLNQVLIRREDLPDGRLHYDAMPVLPLLLRWRDPIDDDDRVQLPLATLERPHRELLSIGVGAGAADGVAESPAPLPPPDDVRVVPPPFWNAAMSGARLRSDRRESEQRP